MFQLIKECVLYLDIGLGIYICDYRTLQKMKSSSQSTIFHIVFYGFFVCDSACLYIVWPLIGKG